MMLLLDAFFRFSGVGVLLLMTVIACKPRPTSIQQRLFLATNLCLIALLLGYAPAPLQLPTTLAQTLHFVDALLPWLTWLLVLSLFQPQFRLTCPHQLIGVLVVIPMLVERLVSLDLIQRLPVWWGYWINAAVLALVLHMCGLLLCGYGDDLNTSRRRARLGFVSLVALSITIMVVLGSIVLPSYQRTVNVMSLWLPIFCSAWWLLKIRNEAFSLFSKSKTKTHFDYRDQSLIQHLELLLSDKQVYLDSELTVEKLASQLGVAAHRLRGLINQRLGYDNFSSYINNFRVEAIKDAFKQPENQHLPILSIALNHGFNSLSPFNRAFKRQTGMTPSAYRKQCE